MTVSRRSVAFGAAGLAMAGPLRAQEKYPARPVTIVVPFGAGGTTDLLGVFWLIVWASGWVAISLSRTRRARGRHRGGCRGQVAAGWLYARHGDRLDPCDQSSVYKTLPYDHVKDFIPLSLVASVPNILMCNPKLPVKTVPELIAMLKKEPGKYFYASSGVGTSIHLAGELFKILAGVDMVHVPYRSSGQITQGLLSGEIAVSFDNITIAWPQVEAGNIRALATATPERLPIAKDLPTVAETLPGFAATSWHGFFAPAGTPAPIAEILSREVQSIMRDPAVVEQLSKLGVTPIGSTTPEFTAHIAAETKRWAEVAAKANIKIE